MRARPHAAAYFVAFAILVASQAPLAAQTIDPATAKPGEGGLLWYDIRPLGVEGQGWQGDAVKSPYDRLPSKAEATVRPQVWSLSRDSAGISVRFATDAPAIHARWSLTDAELAMPHMPATGVSGLDLYVQVDGGKWRWLSNVAPTAQTSTARLVQNLPAGKRSYWLYLPLYNGVTSIEVGIPKENELARLPARDAAHAKPIVFYGTSITHGACASRPGMCHPAILGRWLDRPIVNLGFSGNGRMEMPVADLLAEIDAGVYVLDCLPNIGAAEVTERTEPVVRKLRAARPDAPILLVEDRNYADSFLIASKRERNETSQAALKAAYERLKSAGVTGLYYLSAENLIGDDGEGTVDSSHPTDLGFYRQAAAFRQALEPIFKK